MESKKNAEYKIILNGKEIKFTSGNELVDFKKKESPKRPEEVFEGYDSAGEPVLFTYSEIVTTELLHMSEECIVTLKGDVVVWVHDQSVITDIWNMFITPSDMRNDLYRIKMLGHYACTLNPESEEKLQKVFDEMPTYYNISAKKALKPGDILDFEEGIKYVACPGDMSLVKTGERCKGCMFDLSLHKRKCHAVLSEFPCGCGDLIFKEFE